MRTTLLLLTAAIFSARAAAEESLALRERFEPGSTYRVVSRTELKGELTIPVDKEKPAQKVNMTGRSSIEYDERILPCDKKLADQKTVRHYRTIDFRRLVGDRPQEITLRPEVKRLVVLKKDYAKVPFSPDGALTWGELDMLRTDIFVPALAGLLPDRAVRPGDTWETAPAAIRELTDMEKVERGNLTARFEAIEELGGRRLAHITLNGDLEGINEDGPNRQKLSGKLYFDLGGNFISYLSINGEHYLLDKDGRANGRVAGEFVMVRSPRVSTDALGDESLARIGLEPNSNNTLLLYQERELGVRLLHPRRWRIGRVARGQITLDEANGSGLLITVERPGRVPTGEAYKREAQAFLEKQNAKIYRSSEPARMALAPATIDWFAFDVESAGQRVIMDYYVVGQTGAGATFAARILQSDRDVLRKEVEQMVRSISLTPRPDAK